MPAARAEFHFELDDLWIDEALFGEVIEIVRGAYSIRVRFPQETEGETFEEPRDLKFNAFGSGSAEDQGRRYREIRLLHVDVMFESDLRADEVRGRRSDEGFDHFERASRVAKEVLVELVAWTRVRWGQSWLGPHGAPPRYVLIQSLFDAAGERMPVGWPPITSSIWMGASKTALNQPRIAELAELLERRPRLPLPDLLIADAHLFVRSETESDWPRAVLLAAIGTELAVKTALRDAAAPLGRLQLVQVLLENPRDFSVAAAALFDKVMAAVGRRSLREDNRDLFRGVERLFQTRNGIAHRGEMPDQATTREVVVTASEALAWLRSEETTATP